MDFLNDNVDKLNFKKNVYDVLTSHDINSVHDLWCLKRKELKDWGLRDSEIKDVVIALQLLGLDLNKKKYR